MLKHCLMARSLPVRGRTLSRWWLMSQFGSVSISITPHLQQVKSWNCVAPYQWQFQITLHMQRSDTPECKTDENECDTDCTRSNSAKLWAINLLNLRVRVIFRGRRAKKRTYSIYLRLYLRGKCKIIINNVNILILYYFCLWAKTREIIRSPTNQFCVQVCV